jgi:hypothetical protein
MADIGLPETGFVRLTSILNVVGWGPAGTIPKAREARASDHGLAGRRHQGTYRARGRVTDGALC